MFFHSQANYANEDDEKEHAYYHVIMLHAVDVLGENEAEWTTFSHQSM
jgi:hypothetical protein